MNNFGVSLSVKQCRNFDISSVSCLKWLIVECGFRRFRLMSYWDEIESTPGNYNFQELDDQIKIISKNKGTITLCLGARQPRWPENHWPDWAWSMTKHDRSKALLEFIEVVVERYKHVKEINSYQLENEALLRSFGLNPEVDRHRLRQEFNLVKKLEPGKPVIMTTSTSWGIPIRRPIGDMVGFSYYQTVYNDNQSDYTTAFHKAWLHSFRALLIKVLLRRKSFIHELQLEPWGPGNIWEMSFEEQMKSMDIQQILQNVQLAKKTRLLPIDLWGGEWWYWCYKKHGNKEIIESVLKAIR